MDSVSPLLYRDSAILLAISQSDHEAWCFVPESESLAACCSLAFSVQWNLNPQRDETISIHSLARHVLTQTFLDYGIDPQVLNVVEPCGAAHADAIAIVRNDGVTVELTSTPIFAPDGSKLGQLVRFRNPSDIHLIETIQLEVREAQDRLALLSQRESEILMLVYEGRTNKAISLVTRISEKTVEKHRARIMQKLDVTCAAALYRLVCRARLFSDRDVQVVAEPESPYDDRHGTVPQPHAFRFGGRIQKP